MIYWEMGVLEYHRAVRYFCLNYYDYKILSKEELVFCGQMDNINIMFNKLKYYSYKYCKNYEKDAINIMQELNSGLSSINNENEIEEIKENNDMSNAHNKNNEVIQEQIDFDNHKNININNSNDNNINNENIKVENNNKLDSMEEHIIENDNNFENNEPNQFEDSIDLKKDKQIENEQTR